VEQRRTRSARPSRVPLSRAAIVAAAIEVADTEGVDALSMRRLARHLGYEAMSLYNHVTNKDELLASMVDAVAAEVGRPDAGEPPLVAIRSMAVATREALGRHPWAAHLWLRSVPGSARTRLMDDLLRLLDESGLAPELAHHGFHAVNNHVLGYTLQQLDMSAGMENLDAAVGAYVEWMTAEGYSHMVAHVGQHLAGETTSSFELVLDLILDGLVRLDAER
jgi:AcrR family transcriptional regulator